MFLLIILATCLLTCRMEDKRCNFYTEDGLYNGRARCGNPERICYCFPLQAELDKPCEDITTKDYLNPPYPIEIDCRSNIPNRTQPPIRTPKPTRTPVRTPEMTPEETPAMTPEETPEETPAMTPEETPAMTPEETPARTPEETPNWTIARTRYDTPTLPFETLSANIIQPEVQFAPLYLYILVPIIVVLLIVIALLVICCQRTKVETEEETPDSEPVIIPQNVPIPDYTITVNSEMYNEDSDPFAGDFIVSDDYFDAMETD